MPKKKAIPEQDRASDLLSAALRHVSDAEHLLATSPDQSWHLAGFGPECARKACLGDDWWDKALGHELTDFVEPVLELALALDVRAARYGVAGFTARYPSLAEWRPDARYEKTGTRKAEDAKPLVEAAAQLTCRLAAELWMDGRVVVGT